MNKLPVLQFVIILFLLGPLLSAQKIELKNSQLRRIKENAQFKRVNHFLVRHFPISNTRGKSFKLSYKVDIQRFGHYATIGVGLSHSKFPRKAHIRWTKADGARKLAAVEAKLLPFFSVKHKEFKLPNKVNSLRFAMEYKSESRSMRWSLYSTDKQLLQQTPWVKVKEDLSFDQFSVWSKVRATEVEKDPSSIRVDKNKIKVVSQVGKSMGYLHECRLSEIKLEIIKEKDQ